MQRGLAATRWQTLDWIPPMLLATLEPQFVGAGGLAYTVTAAISGAGFLALAVQVSREKEGIRWARALFVYSIIYLTVLFGVLLATAGHAQG